MVRVPSIPRRQPDPIDMIEVLVGRGVEAAPIKGTEAQEILAELDRKPDE
ncbi:MAG: hypothetical protein K0R85_329 [Devosia sp.]|jgi:hypothetical protein|nr:hypothetical protein [Devosia sp.]